MLDEVEIRAFRGTRRSSVYRVHIVVARNFARIREAAERQALRLLASLDARGTHELDKRQARLLADDAAELRRSLELPDLDDELVAIERVARWCARAPGDAWLTIDGAR